MCRLGPLFGLKILNFNIFWNFRKINIFLGYEDFMGILGGHYKIWLVLGIISMHLGSFLKVMVQNGDIFWGC